MKKTSVILFFSILFCGKLYAKDSALNTSKAIVFKEYVCQTSETYNKKGNVTSKTIVYCDDAAGRVTRSKTVYY